MCTTRSSSHLLGGLPQCMLDTPQVWAWRPPWVWAWRPPRCGPGDPPGCGPRDPSRPDPSTSPLGVGLETPPGQTPQLPPWVWAWRPARHAGIPPIPPRIPARHAGIPPPLWTEFLTHASENITLPQTSFAGGNKNFI